MEDNRCEYGFGGDGQSYEDSNYMYKDQDRWVAGNFSSRR